jgi:predicted nucleic acid-binding protein
VSRFVLDCSVTMAWCFEDEFDEYAAAVLRALITGSAVVPPLWGLEIANVLLVAERRRRITPDASARFLELLHDLPVTVAEPDTPGDLGELLRLGRAHRLSAYDAGYLLVARRERLALATRDASLRAAARSAGIGIFAPDS